MASLEGAQFTLTDVDVGSRLVEALVRHVRQAGPVPIAYEDLLTLGRNMYPKDAVLGRAVPVGIGMKLRFVAGFCAAHGYPDLASLAVSPARMPSAAARGNNAEPGTAAIAAANFSDIEGKLSPYAAAIRAAVPKRFKPRKERPADVAWYAFFCSHRAACAHVTGEDKQEIINLLMAGLDPQTALDQVMAAKAEQ